MEQWTALQGWESFTVEVAVKLDLTDEKEEVFHSSRMYQNF